MTKPLAIWCLALLTPLNAQDRPDPQVQLERKLQSPFLKAAPWVLDFDQALARARAREQIVLGYFTTAGP